MKRTILFSIAAIMFVAASCDDILEDKVERGDDSPSLSPEKGDDSAIDRGVFDILNLDAPGLSKVKEAYEVGNYYTAAVELRNYWRSRSAVFNPNVDLIGTTVLASQQRIAEQSLEHRFYINQNYYESVSDNVYTYFLFEKDGKIDWTYVPDKYSGDQEFYYQIHRHNWVPSVGKVYWASRDEEYAKSFRDTYISWSDAYPVPVGVVFPSGESNNVNYQWKGLQPAVRILNYLDALPYVIQSDNITPEFFCRFLKEFAQSVECVRKNYYTETNILISQSKAVVTAGILMPELAASANWREDGISKLAAELNEQFFADGVHYEFDPSYHISAISDFLAVYELAKANSSLDLLPSGYIDRLEKAAEFVVDITFPDYSIDNFNDTRNSSYNRSVLTRNFRKYAQVFPDNTKFMWMATAGSDGTKPDYLTKAYPDGGYYMLRNGWDSDSKVLVFKNNSNVTNKWHCQPDNGTFALWSHGRNFFPDAGCFAYNGSVRTRYRATSNHNTLTISGKTYGSSFLGSSFVSYDFGHAQSVPYTGYVTEHPVQSGVVHTRAVYFVDNCFYVILDKVTGKLSGETVELNYHLLADGNSGNVYTEMTPSSVWKIYTQYADGNDLVMAVASSEAAVIEENIFTPYSSSLNVETGKREGFRIKADGLNHAENGSSTYFATVLLPSVEVSSSDVALSFTKDLKEINITASYFDGAKHDYSITLPNIK